MASKTARQTIIFSLFPFQKFHQPYLFLTNYMKGLCEQFLFPQISQGKLRLCTPSTQEAIGWEAELSWYSFEVRCSTGLLYLEPFREMPRCPAIYCIWHLDDCQVSLCRFWFIFLNIYESRMKFLSWYQQQSITVWFSLHGTRHNSYYYLHILCIICVRIQLIISQTFSMSLPKNKTDLLSCPRGPVLLIWCRSRAHPNIMHFPSPENLHTAQ